jgi:hypothetical protein
MHGLMHRCVDGWVDGWVDAWMHRCMDAWIHGCMDACGSKFREEKFGWKCAKWVYGRALVPPGRVAFPRGSKPPPARQQVETKRSASCKPSGSDLPRYCNHDICFQLKLQSPKPPPVRALYQQTRGPLFTPRAPSAHRKRSRPPLPRITP